MSEIKLEERIAVALAKLILDPSAPPARHIAVGAASPMPAAACWLVKKQGHPVRLSLDGSANLNLVGTGEWPGMGVRFPGSFGSAFMYFMTPRTILFREEHTPRVFVEKVDNISAPGVSPPGVFRRGTAQALVTGRCVFRFHPDRARFSLESVHTGETVESVRDATGFAFDVTGDVPFTPDPTAEELALLRGPICDEMLEIYPEFCARVFGRKQAA